MKASAVTAEMERGARLTVSKMTLDGFFIRLVLDVGSLKPGGASGTGGTAIIIQPSDQ